MALWSARPVFDPLVQAATGAMAAQGGYGSPVFTFIGFCDMGAGLVAALGTAAALFQARRDQRGKRVDTSVLLGGLAMQTADTLPSCVTVQSATSAPRISWGHTS